jgi:hypothetical protein
MRVRHPYEQLLADKLRKLPVPDQEASWQQMKSLLDDADNRGGGIGKPPGSGWWKLGILALLLPAGFWLYHSLTASSGSGTATPLAENLPVEPAKLARLSGQTSKEKNEAGSNKHSIQPLLIDKKTTLYTAPSANRIEPASPATSASGNAARETNGARPTREVYVSPAPAVIDRGAASPAIGTVPTHLDRQLSRPANGKTYAYPATTAHSNSNNQQPTAGSARHNFSLPGYTVAADRMASGTLDQNTTAATASNTSDAAVAQPNFGTGPSYTTGQPADSDDRFTAGGFLLTNNRIGRAAVVPDSTRLLDNTGISFNTDTKKGIAKAQREAAIAAATKKDKKGLHLDLSNLFQPFSLRLDPEPRWAAGIAINSGITLNAQNRYTYNSNAKSGILTDYIPSVYLQYHFNDVVYAQAEINFISPQFTPQVLVFHVTTDMPSQPGSSMERTVNLEKLYYFNLPFTLHYSPVNNFYLSAGFRFSSFQSGLVSIREKQYVTAAGADHPTYVSTRVEKFRDDSIAARLSPNEWRWQAGAEYYWNRFTLGLSYNQSFKHLFADPTSLPVPDIKLRNEALLLTLRYNLFESRKKGSGDQK